MYWTKAELFMPCPIIHSASTQLHSTEKSTPPTPRPTGCSKNYTFYSILYAKNIASNAITFDESGKIQFTELAWFAYGCIIVFNNMGSICILQCFIYALLTFINVRTYLSHITIQLFNKLGIIHIGHISIDTLNSHGLSARPLCSTTLLFSLNSCHIEAQLQTITVIILLFLL